MKISILQWNVWFREDIDNVIDVIKGLDVDVVCLQELTHGYIGQTQDNTWEYVQRELGFNRAHQSIPIITDTEQWQQANAIFTRFPINNRISHWLHEPAREDDKTDQYRGYLEVELQVADFSVDVATTHMSFQQYPMGSDHELQNLLDITKNKSQRYILTGDFNVTPDSRRVEELSKVLNHVGPKFSENTWTTKPHINPEFQATTLDWRYDYIFASRDFRVIDAKILDTDVSDHLPVLATLEIADR